MPLIERPVKEEKRALAVQVRKETYDEVVRYAQFLGADLGYTVDRLLEHVMQKDREFQGQTREQKIKAVA